LFTRSACSSMVEPAMAIDTVDCLTVEVDMGSATSWGRHPDRAWLIRLGRGDRSVIVAWGLSRAAADSLAEHITDLVGCPGGLTRRDCR
jgi:hypothetical protein